MPTIGFGINHKGTKHRDKCSNNKTKTTQKQNYEITFSEYCKHNARKLIQDSTPSGAEVKNAWSYTSTPPMSSWRSA
jgi:hypothetical protein